MLAPFTQRRTNDLSRGRAHFARFNLEVLETFWRTVLARDGRRSGISRFQP